MTGYAASSMEIGTSGDGVRCLAEGDGNVVGDALALQPLPAGNCDAEALYTDRCELEAMHHCTLEESMSGPGV